MEKNMIETTIAATVETTEAPKASKPAKVPSQRGRGRPAKISERAFMEVVNKSASVADVVSRFRSLREMDPVKAKAYVSIRAFNLRAKGCDVKTFPRGRKATLKATETPSL
jgi:hypothetical protein